MKSTISVVLFLLGLLPSSAMAQEILRMPERPSNNYNFLNGCWITDKFQHTPNNPVGRSTYCFGDTGRGTLVYESAIYTCRLVAEARFEGNYLKLVDSNGTCSNGGPWNADTLECRRGADNVAFCSGHSIHPSTRLPTSWTVNLRRVGPASTASPPPASAPGGKPQKFKSMLD